ncbi:MAG: KpsF/GutQ family sugar-phosphate isomerase [Planctomycetes bacterium]|nr:KpsF/GutQ family sugar-phosphate isomerase [Planctomycetota bacterium]
MKPQDAHSPQLSPFQQQALAREILWSEGQALLLLSERLPRGFSQAVEVVLACQGSVIVSGMGKTGLIGQKIAATLASTGAAAHFLHPAEAVHGDLGRVGPRDVVLMLSFSGESEEIVRLLPALRAFGNPIIAITGRAHSTLARQATVALDLGMLEEACPLGLAPSTSTTAMLALGDALALVASKARGFTADDFYRYHPAGSLGRRLTRVEDAMRPLGECRIARESQSVREAFATVRRAGRRTGAIMLVDDQGMLTGIFTDSDLARLVEDRRDDRLDCAVREVMTRRPKAIRRGARLGEAVDLLAGGRISELPVIDEAGRPCGLIDITDVLGSSAEQATPDQPADAAPAPQRKAA